MQNGVYAEFDTRRLFSRSSAEEGKFLHVHLKSDFNMGNEDVFVNRNELRSKLQSNMPLPQM